MTERQSERKSDRTRAAILAAARERFAADGYERATIRAIAGEAGVDPALVMRYFGSKEKLFATAADFELGLPDLTAVPRDELGAALTNFLLDRWEHDETIQALLRAGVTNPQVAEYMRTIFTTQLTPTIERLGIDRPSTRAALVASQALGLALTRYILKFPPITALTRTEIVAWVAPVLTRYLTDPLPR